MLLIFLSMHYPLNVLVCTQSLAEAEKHHMLKTDAEKKMYDSIRFLLEEAHFVPLKQTWCMQDGCCTHIHTREASA